MKNMKMWKCETLRKLLLVIGSIFTMATFAYSAEVTSAEAQEAVAGWAALKDALEGQFDAPIGGVETFTGLDGTGTFYVVSFEGGGYVVTSGDTEVTPILAYSQNGEFVAGEENPLWCMLVMDVAEMTKKPSGSAPISTGMNCGELRRCVWIRVSGGCLFGIA